MTKYTFEMTAKGRMNTTVEAKDYEEAERLAWSELYERAAFDKMYEADVYSTGEEDR